MDAKTFEKYVNQLTDPDKIVRANNWKVGIGLQTVDNLRVSEFLLDVAYKNIEGQITMREANKIIDEHYLT